MKLLPKDRKLNKSEMQQFGRWLSLDLATREGRQGKHATKPMRGMWRALVQTKNPGVKQPGRLRSSDFSWRVALLVHGWSLTRISVLAASVKVASEYEVFLNRLGNSNRGRRTEGGERADYPEETIRTFYYKFCGTHPQMDQEFDLAWSLYIEWKEWAIAADEQTIKMALQLYRESGRPPEDTEQFATLVKELRSEVTQAEWDEENKRRLEVYRSRSQSDPRSANAVTTVAYFLHKARKFAEAITNYENARELTKADPELPVWRKDEIRRWIDDQIQRCEKGTAPVRHEVPYVPPSLQVIGPTSARPQPRDAAKPGKRH